jgi:hypothetical protein
MSGISFASAALSGGTTAWLNPLAPAPTIDGSPRHRPVLAGDRPTVKRAAPGLSLVDDRRADPVPHLSQRGVRQLD